MLQRVVFCHQRLTLVIERVVETIVAITSIDPAMQVVLEEHMELDGLVFGEEVFLQDPDGRVLFQVRARFGVPFALEIIDCRHVLSSRAAGALTVR